MTIILDPTDPEWKKRIAYSYEEGEIAKVVEFMVLLNKKLEQFGIPQAGN